MNSISIKNLCKSYDEKTVLHDINLEIPYGERLAFMAPSGYGKTTLLRQILGLERPDRGEITGVPEKNAVVFQEDRLLEDFSLKTNVNFSKSRLVDKEYVEKVLTDFKLIDELKTPVKKLSGGMKRRVSIVRALCSDYELLVMDEPFKGLDSNLKDGIISAVDKYSGGKTLILVTHDINEAKQLGCKIIDLQFLNNR